MDGFTVRNSNRFLQTGQINQGVGDRQSLTTGLSTGVAKGPLEVGESFASTLQGAIESVNQLQKAADKGAQDLATGRTDNIAEVMVSSEKADIALKLMVQVRNKIIDAYSEIMKMQV